MKKHANVESLKSKCVNILPASQRGMQSGSLHFSYSGVAHEQNYEEKKKKTDHSKQNDRILSGFQPVFLKAEKKNDFVGKEIASLDNKSKYIDICYIIL